MSVCVSSPAKATQQIFLCLIFHDMVVSVGLKSEASFRAKNSSTMSVHRL